MVMLGFLCSKQLFTFLQAYTVLVIGKVFLASLIILIVVKIMAIEEVCTVNVPLHQLPEGVQLVLSEHNQQHSWQCPYSKSFDIFYILDLVPPKTETVLN